MASTLEDIRQAIQQQAQQDHVQVQQLATLQLNEIPIKKLTPQMKKEIEKCKNLQTLSLSGCELQSLQNLPTADLSAIDLSKNSLHDNDISKLSIYKELTQVLLGQNKISKLETIKVLASLQNLQQLQLSGNPVAEQSQYKDYAFNNLNKLQYLDGADQQGNLLPQDQQQFDDDQDDEQDEQFDDDQDQDQEEQSDEEQSPQPKKKR